MSLGQLHMLSRPPTLVQDCDDLYYMFHIRELFQVAGKFVKSYKPHFSWKIITGRSGKEKKGRSSL
jgi:hypothetical protein